MPLPIVGAFVTGIIMGVGTSVGTRLSDKYLIPKLNPLIERADRFIKHRKHGRPDFEARNEWVDWTG